MLRLLSLVIPALIAPTPALPGPTSPQRRAADSLEATLKYQTGSVTIGDGLATFHLPPSLRFLDQVNARKVLVDGWRNPPEVADRIFGMIVPADVGPMQRGGWGIVVSFDQEGYVDDKDAATIDYGKLLKQMQDATEQANPERKKAGYPAIQLIGWAEPPHYDSAAHKLYWARELAFQGDSIHTLNYNIRILGRRGVLVLNAVAGMDQLAMVRDRTPSVLAAVEFNQGQRYADYVDGVDQKAAYGIAGLILGAAVVKTGLLKGIWLAILALKKAIIAGAAAVTAWVKSRFRRKNRAGAPPDDTIAAN